MSHITEDSSTADEDGIRPYRPADLKQVQLLVGAGVMEQLAGEDISLAHLLKASRR